MNIREKAEQLQIYANLSNDEWGETLQALINMAHYAYGCSIAFGVALAKELDEQLEYINESVRITTTETVTQPVTTQELEFKGIDF
jgi:hypothetical protein